VLAESAKLLWAEAHDQVHTIVVQRQSRSHQLHALFEVIERLSETERRLSADSFEGAGVPDSFEGAGSHVAVRPAGSAFAFS
jgi:hypothetical protein